MTNNMWAHSNYCIAKILLKNIRCRYKNMSLGAIGSRTPRRSDDVKREKNTLIKKADI